MNPKIKTAFVPDEQVGSGVKSVRSSVIEMILKLSFLRCYDNRYRLLNRDGEPLQGSDIAALATYACTNEKIVYGKPLFADYLVAAGIEPGMVANENIRMFMTRGSSNFHDSDANNSQSGFSSRSDRSTPKNTGSRAEPRTIASLKDRTTTESTDNSGDPSISFQNDINDSFSSDSTIFREPPSPSPLPQPPPLKYMALETDPRIDSPKNNNNMPPKIRKYKAKARPRLLKPEEIPLPEDRIQKGNKRMSVNDEDGPTKKVVYEDYGS